MEATEIELSINKKVQSIITQLKKHKFSLKENKLSEREWIISELKKVSIYYKISFIFSTLIIGIVFIISFFRILEVMPMTNNKDASLSILGIIASISGAFNYKIQRERLNEALYLLDMKLEIEKLKNK